MRGSVLTATELVARVLSNTSHVNTCKGLPSKIGCFGIIILLLLSDVLIQVACHVASLINLSRQQLIQRRSVL